MQFKPLLIAAGALGAAAVGYVLYQTAKAPATDSPSANEGTHMASSNVVQFTDANFKTEVLEANVPVLVDFWAEWCMPCKMLGPTIDQIAEDFAGRVKVGKVDTDSNRTTAAQYGISAIPTVIIFKNGQVARKFVGLQSKGEFAAALEAASK